MASFLLNAYHNLTSTIMKRSKIIFSMVFMAMALLSTSAMAQARVIFTTGMVSPYGYPPVYGYAPQPVYYPPPVYGYAPQPVYYPPSYYVRPGYPRQAYRHPYHAYNNSYHNNYGYGNRRGGGYHCHR
jgi:hypothetical protein